MLLASVTAREISVSRLDYRRRRWHQARKPHGRCSVSSALPRISLQRERFARSVSARASPDTFRLPEAFISKAQLCAFGVFARTQVLKKTAGYRSATLDSRNRITI